MKKVTLGLGVFILICIGLVLFVAITFSYILIPLFPIILAVIVYFSTKTQRTFIKKKPTPIYQLTEGWVKIEGTVSASKIFETPYFKQQCFAYTYEEAKIDYSADSGSEYTVSAELEENFQDFYLTNATGKIKVIANKLNLSNLPSKTEVKHSIKYAVNDIRYTERTLKNGDLISVLGYAVKNSNYGFELREQGEKILVIGTPDFEDKTCKSFRVIKYLLPYLILMYLAVNYFLFFAPVKQHIEQNTAFILFCFFGMPILGVVLAIIGSKLTGFSKDFFSGLGGICILVTLLSFPLLCLLLITKTEFYTILCVWASIFFCTTLSFIMNYRKLDGIFEKEKI